MTTVYRKTADGQDEIATRARRLPPRLRSLLILIDGKRDDDALRAMVPDADALVAELASAGLIERIAAASRAEPARMAEAVPASAGGLPVADMPNRQTPQPPAPPPTQPVPLSPSAVKARSRAASRWLNERLGPSGEAAAIRVESAKTPEQFEQAMLFAAKVVDARLGPAAAQALITHVSTL
jgi:hypothetical protein